MDFSFNSKEELYQMVLPALNTKKSELDRFGYNYIHKNDVWSYLVKTKWSYAHNLELSDVVSDILNCDNRLLDSYVKKSLASINEDSKNLEVI